MESHKFPNPRYFLANFDKWVEIIGDDLHTIDPNEVYFKKRVCSVHFTENDRSPGTNRLKCNVVPSLNLPVSSSYRYAKLPDIPKSTAVSIRSIDLDVSGVQELDGDLINLIGMLIHVFKLINGFYIILCFFCY